MGRTLPEELKSSIHISASINIANIEYVERVPTTEIQVTIGSAAFVLVT